MMANVVLIAAIFVPGLLMVGLVLGYRAWLRRDSRRSPLVERQHHTPGQQLIAGLQDHDDEIGVGLMLMMLAAPISLLAWALRFVPWSQLRMGWDMLLFAFCAVLIFGYGWRHFSRHVRLRRLVQDGLAGERMTAQQLAPLSAEGCPVFHDVPASAAGRTFNLDHVVIGPSAVFVVETKSRRKPPIKGKESAQVAFDGAALRFPDHVTREPIEQARALARWLTDYLRGAAGEPVTVVPVVALPGW
jgi:hypothetical protein